MPRPYLRPLLALVAVAMCEWFAYYAVRTQFVELLIAPIALSLISRLVPPLLRGTALGLWVSSSLATGHAYAYGQRVLFETDLVSSRFALPAIAVAAGVFGYVLLSLLGLTRRHRVVA